VDYLFRQTRSRYPIRTGQDPTPSEMLQDSISLADVKSGAVPEIAVERWRDSLTGACFSAARYTNPTLYQRVSYRTGPIATSYNGTKGGRKNFIFNALTIDLRGWGSKTAICPCPSSGKPHHVNDWERNGRAWKEKTRSSWCRQILQVKLVLL
jgi:cellulase/cellobiase CelA1